MFSFLHLLYTADFKADGWILITVKTEDPNFCLDITATPEKIHFLGLMESSLSAASSVNGQTRKIKKKKKKEESTRGVMSQKHIGASHSQGICLIP